jgi:hypothetical protein
MRKFLFLAIVAGLVCGISFVGCTKKAASSQEAIESSKTMQDVKQQASYLMGQANAFYNSKNFQEAVNIAQYVLSYLDKNSQEAQSLLDKAKEQIKALGAQKIDALKGKLGVGK